MERLDKSAFSKLKGTPAKRWEVIRKTNHSHVMALFEQGHSVNSIARQSGVSRSCVNKIMQEIGINRPDVSEGNRRAAAMTTESYRKSRASAAHNAVRLIGRHKPTQINHAERKQITGDYIGVGEVELSERLLVRGFHPISQAAVEGYNIDLLCDHLAVEVHNFTSSPTNKTQLVTRTIKLLCSGISVIYVKTGPNFPVISDAAVNQIIAFYDFTSGNPSRLGQYRVIRGDGEIDWSSKRHLDELADIVATYAEMNARAKDHR